MGWISRAKERYNARREKKRIEKVRVREVIASTKPRNVIPADELPDDILYNAHKIAEIKQTMFHAGVGGTLTSAVTVWRELDKDLPYETASVVLGAAVAEGTLARNYFRARTRLRWAIGLSKNPKIMELRNHFRYFYLDRRWNMVGTNSRGIFGKDPLLSFSTMPPALVYGEELPMNITAQISRLSAESKKNKLLFAVAGAGATAVGIGVAAKAAKVKSIFTGTGGIIILAAGAVAGARYGVLSKRAEELSEMLKNSENPMIMDLRARFKYVYIDEQGNLVGTNRPSKLLAMVTSRPRIPLK